jgi:hypothetical protein
MVNWEIFPGTILHNDIPTAIFIRMIFEERAYMGYLGVNDAVFCYRLECIAAGPYWPNNFRGRQY